MAVRGLGGGHAAAVVDDEAVSDGVGGGASDCPL